jgi:FkbM family methyltransferase
MPNPITIAGMRIRYGDPDLFRLTFREIFIGRAYAPPGEVAARRIIDAGANIGLSTLFLAREYPEAHILCFEPNPESAALLAWNINANNVSATVYPFALGAEDGEREFFYLKGESGDIGHSSAHALRDVFHAQEAVGSHTLPIRSPRPWLEEPVDVMKMDIEGGEGEVLAASEDLLGHVRHLVMEFHHIPRTVLLGEILNILERAGHIYELDAKASNRPGAVALIRTAIPEA